MLIGISGKIGTGKSHTAKFIAAKTGRKVVSFGDAVKREVSRDYNIPIDACYSQEGKLKSFLVTTHGLKKNMILRELLQFHGQMRREANPAYWIEKTIPIINKAGNFCIVDDVRNSLELESLRKLGNSYMVRINPYEGWEPGEFADDISETALDDYEGFDLIVTPDFGKLESVADWIVDRTAVGVAV